MMILVVDVGNTASLFGLFEMTSPDKMAHPSFVWTLSTSELKKKNVLAPFLKRNFKAIGRDPKRVIGGAVASVVPEVDSQLGGDLRRLCGFSFPFISGTTRSKVLVHYKKPREVGADRLVNARAAMELHKGHSIVIDFGTATTFDCISKKGEYLGGVITPGPLISAEALYERTAKLPLVRLERPAKILGQNTLESIQAGLYHGYRGLVKEIIFQLSKKMRGHPKLFVTGGQAHWVLKDLGISVHPVPDLTLVGLYYMWKDITGR